MISEGLSINNAGLVLISSYFTLLFERLQLTSEYKFITTQHQHAAVYHLNVLATGLEVKEDYNLILNKILCGLPFTETIPYEMSISDDDKLIMESLIHAAISHWPAVGDSSIEGFRGNWLLRNGIIKEEFDQWTLNVEKRPYDLLIYKSPYSFSIIKFPWMDKPLHVIWPF